MPAYAVIQDLELRLCRYFFMAEWEERRESCGSTAGCTRPSATRTPRPLAR